MLRCDSEKCEAPGVIRVFELRPEGALLSPLLCERHALRILGRYMRKCADGRKQLSRTARSRFTVACIGICMANDTAHVFLRGDDGIHFPFELATLKALTLGILVSRYVRGTRALPHQTMATIIDALGGAIREVVIYQSAEREYGARIEISTLNDPTHLYLHASDGLALALAAGVPVRVCHDLVLANMERAARSAMLDALKTAWPNLDE